jgi:hypothetical protein
LYFVRNSNKTVIEKPEVNRALRKHGSKWENNIKTGLKEAECEDMDRLMWFGFGAMAGSCEHGNELSSYAKSGEIRDYPSDLPLLNKGSVCCTETEVVGMSSTVI